MLARIAKLAEDVFMHRLRSVYRLQNQPGCFGITIWDADVTHQMGILTDDSDDTITTLLCQRAKEIEYLPRRRRK